MTVCIMQRKNKLGKALAVLFALLLWQIAAVAVDQKILLVSPVDVAVRMTSIWQVEGFASSIWFSFYHIAGGFLLALVVGVLLAALSGRFPWIETALWPFMITVKTVPVASFVVICLIWLSAQNLSVFISFLIVLPVVYGNVLEGIKSEDKKNARGRARVRNTVFRARALYPYAVAQALYTLRVHDFAGHVVEGRRRCRDHRNAGRLDRQAALLCEDISRHRRSSVLDGYNRHHKRRV